MRKQGFNVFYGDATNVNLLKSAGAEKAKYFVAALDPPEINQKLVTILRKNFPHLEIFVRAKNRSYAYNYLKDGLNEVYRENFFSSVYVGRQILLKYGFSYEDASKIGEIFIKSDRKSLRKIAKLAENSDQYFEASKQEFEKQMKMVAKEIKIQNDADSE